MTITVLDVTRYTLSNIAGFNSALATFEADEDMIAWRVNRLGASYDTGTILEENDCYWSSADDTTWGNHASNKAWSDLAYIAAGVDITAQILSSDLQEGEQQINVYGRDKSGNWTT